MGITLDEAKEIIKHPIYYFPAQREEALDVLIDTARKYQKIEQIIQSWNKTGGSAEEVDILSDIEKVVEDGTENNHYASNS